MQKISIWAISVMIIACILIMSNTGYASTGDINPPDYDPLDRSATWDCIYFGKYWQNSNTEKEPIKWRVLSVNGNDACILSDKILDRQPYTYAWGYNTIWKNSYARKWLNEVFYKEAFDESERAAIIEREYDGISSFDNYIQGEYVKDRITIPSFKDLQSKEAGFFSVRDDMKRSNRAARTTRYISKEKEAYATWCLRGSVRKISPFQYGVLMCIGSRGDVELLHGHPAGFTESYEKDNLLVQMCKINLRPIMHIDLSKGGWTKAESYSSYQDCREEAEEVYFLPDKEYVIKKPVIKKQKSIKKKAKLSWKKTDNATSYSLWYSTSKSFSKKKTKKINLGKNSYTIKKLKKRKKYYVKVRGVLKVDQITTKGKWSKVKKI